MIQIALIDSGTDPTRLDRARLMPGANFTEEGAADDTGDALGHGTAVADTILRAAPNARVLPIKLIDRRGVLRDPGQIETAFDWILDRVEALEIGLVCAAFADVRHHVDDDRFRGARLQQQIAALREGGIPTVAPAGNGYRGAYAQSSPGMAWPAILREVVSVGAAERTPNGLRLSPNTRRLHPTHGAGCCTTIFAEPGAPGDTSGAAAVVAARLAALRAENDAATVTELVQRLLQDAVTGQDESGLSWPVMT